MSTGGISVIIPTFERPEALADAVRDVVEQLPAGGELLVVDQSSPSTRERNRRMVSRLGGTHLSILPPSLPNARNEGLRATSRPIILFLDDDVRLSPGCLRAHLDAFEQAPELGGAVGRIVERRVKPNAEAVTNTISLGGRVRTNLDGTSLRAVEILKGANMSFRRTALNQAGDFDANYLGTALLEDADISSRVASAGWKLAFLPKAMLTHLSVPSGGVRQLTPQATERWRFHNTAYYISRHRGRRSFAPVGLTFGAIALKRGLQWRALGTSVDLLQAFAAGWRLASQ